VLLGVGGGKLAGRVDYGVGVDPQALASGDVNGDGRLDLVVPNRAAEPSLSVLLGKGDGGESFVLGGVNGDGSPDLVAAGPARSVTVLLNSCR
jgi:hypothetical protein